VIDGVFVKACSDADSWQKQAMHQSFTLESMVIQSEHNASQHIAGCASTASLSSMTASTT
jgi:hypothetical protein